MVPIIRRAKMKDVEEMPDWATHCPAFLQAIIETAPQLEDYKDGSFDIDISELEYIKPKCAICGFLLPELKGYKIVSEKMRGKIVVVDLIHIAEGEINETST